MATNHPLSAPQKNWKVNWEALTHDDILEEIHAYRAELYERFGGDAEAIFRYYQERERQNEGRRSTAKVLPRRILAQ